MIAQIDMAYLTISLIGLQNRYFPKTVFSVPAKGEVIGCINRSFFLRREAGQAGSATVGTGQRGA